MSRIGKQPVKIQQGVKVDIKGNLIRVEGPKGKLEHSLPDGVSAKVDSGAISITTDENVENSGALHGLTRTLVSNMVHGAHTGFSKELEVVGVGYRAATKGNVLTLNVGYSHPIDYTLPTGIAAKVDANTKVTISGADKTLVGMVAAKIRSFKKPEPYQGKGIKYVNEHIVRKQGKAASGGK